MTKKELIEKLQDLPDDLPVFAMNTCIENDEYCPVFPLLSIEKHEENPASGAFISLQFSDELYINQAFNING